MNTYDLIAPFYDVEHAHFSEDLDMYQNFAESSGQSWNWRVVVGA